MLGAMSFILQRIWENTQGNLISFFRIVLILCFGIMIGHVITSLVTRRKKWDWFIWTFMIFAVLAIGGYLLGLHWEDLRDNRETLSTTIRNVGLVFGGFIAMLLAVWRSIVAERQADTAQQSSLNERYERGAEMLGSNVVSVRLAGIYALERLAAEYPEQHHIQIMKLYCAFARHPTNNVELDIPPDYGSAQPSYLELRVDQSQRLREDVQAVMNTIGYGSPKRIALETRDQFQLDLRGADLSNATLYRADLSGANLSEAKLSRARLMRANLSKAHLWHADLSCSSDNMTFDKTVLDGAKLCGANLMYANLSGARLQEAQLTRANLFEADMSHTFLYKAKLVAACIGMANLSGAVLNEAILSGARLDKGHVLGTWLTSHEDSPTTRLTQEQLDSARADSGNPPHLNGVLDAETGEPLVWRGGP